jgi:hypothetical protein
MILQANSFGNANSTTLGSGFRRSAVELYNNTAAPIDLTAGNFYLHIGSATAWEVAIKLEGTVPAFSSFLVIDNTHTEADNVTNTTDAVAGTHFNATPRAAFPAADQYHAFVIGNNGFKIALMRNQATLTVNNPFTEVSMIADFVDLLGVGGNGTAGSTNFPNAFKGMPIPNANPAPFQQSRPRVPRRASLFDTHNNLNDYTDVDYRGANDAFWLESPGVLDQVKLARVWPRNATMGAWNPITGELITP